MSKDQNPSDKACDAYFDNPYAATSGSYYSDRVTFYAGFAAGAASRDAEIQRLQMALADAEALELGIAEHCDQLRVELAAALAACKAKDEALLTCQPGDCSTGHVIHPSFDEMLVESALAIQPDTSALEAIVKKAGEVMRERSINVAWNNEPDCNGPIEMEIRALPAVTLEDLK